MPTATATAAPTASFEVGQTVSCRSASNHECVWTFEVVKRTAKFVTLRDTFSGEENRVGVKVSERDGVEYALPFGSYSMAPVVRAA